MIQTYIFTETGSIPGLPNPASADGQFPAGMAVDVDTDTMTILAVRLRQGQFVPASDAEETESAEPLPEMLSLPHEDTPTSTGESSLEASEE